MKQNVFPTFFFKLKKNPANKKTTNQTKPNSGNDYQKRIIINSQKCILQSIIDKTVFP